MSRSNGESIADVLTPQDIATQEELVDTTIEYQYDTLDDVITNILRKEQDKKVELSISILEKIEVETNKKEYITPFFNKAKELISRTKELDKKVRKILTNAPTRINQPGATFDFCNYNYRIKSLQSLVRKILFDFLEKKYDNDFDKFKEDHNLITNISSFLSNPLNIKDIFRCSFILSDSISIFKSQFVQILRHLKDNSIYTISVKNSFLRGNSYKDIKVFAAYVMFPEQIFEIQFQTKQTSQIKFKAHEIYESVRTNVSCEPDMIEKRKKELNECIQLYNSAPVINIRYDQVKDFGMAGKRVELQNKRNNVDTINCTSTPIIVEEDVDDDSEIIEEDGLESAIEEDGLESESVARGYRKRKTKRKSKRKTKRKSKRKTKRKH